MKTCAIYIRVSTDKQEELSPDAQKRLLLDYAKKHHFLTSEELIFTENGISGKKANKRPEFMKMIGMAKSKNHPFDIILVWKYSRFARNQEESIVYKSLLKRNGIDVISVSEPLVDGPFGSLIERIIEWMDEYYSIRLSGEVTRGMTEKALRGGYQASPPLGYRIDRHGEPPVIVNEEAKIVRLIFDMYVNNNKSVYEIVKYLNNYGYKTKNGNLFEKRSIQYILQNPIYDGRVRWNRCSSITNTVKDQSEWIIRDGEQQPIISKEIFEAAKNRYESEYTPRKSRPAETQKHWLSGLIKCSNCGRTLVASSRFDKRYNKTYWNFQCYGYQKGKCTVSHQISELKIVPAVINALTAFILDDSASFKIVKQQLKGDTSIIENQLSKISQKELRIKEAYRNGVDTLDEYKENKKILLNEKESLEKQLLDIQSKEKESGSDKQILNKRVKNVCEIIKDDSIDMVTKNKAMKSVVEKIIYHKKEQAIDIVIYFSEH